MRPLVLFTCLFAATSAHAITYVGNPDLGFTIQDTEGDLTSGSVDLDFIEVEDCYGNWASLNIDATIDPVTNGWDSPTTLPLMEYCEAKIHWGSTLTLYGSNADGPFEVTVDHADTHIVFDATYIAPKKLYPYSVKAGTPVGTPQVHLVVAVP